MKCLKSGGIRSDLGLLPPGTQQYTVRKSGTLFKRKRLLNKINRPESSQDNKKPLSSLFGRGVLVLVGSRMNDQADFVRLAFSAIA